MSLNIQVTLDGASEVDQVLQAIRNSLTSRAGMHQKMASYGQKITQDKLIADTRHKSADRLGATPTNFRSKSADRVEAQFDEDEGRVVIPRDTGLGRAFGDVLIRPGSGRKYLTIPGHADTYGRPVKSFGDGELKFAIFKGQKPSPVLLFAADGGRHKKGDVAYWLRREVSQKQDRTLLPPDSEYYAAARGGAIDYLREEMKKS